jgi:ElaB/YqjD/DUF883 family membrane-anchored ribosome-binding protein
MNTPLASNPTAETAAARNRVNDALASAKNSFNDFSDNATKTIKKAAESTDGFVRDNPWIAIGVAAGVAGAVGFLAGLLSAPRKRFF